MLRSITMTTKKILFCLFILSTGTFAADNGSLNLELNKGQWENMVRFRSDIPGGRMWLEQNRISFVYYNLNDLNAAHEAEHENQKSDDLKIRCHAFRMNFVNASINASIDPAGKFSHYSNYFIGNNPAKWASEVPNYGDAFYRNLYDGIDLHVYGNKNNPEYDFIVSPEADANNIAVSFEGANGLKLNNGDLCIKTSVNEIIHSHPIAYQIINGVYKEVVSKYVLKNNALHFNFPKGYNKHYQLIIDPILLASTYSGSTATTYGHCATYDAAGDIFTGGRCFGSGYPVTAGAFDLSFGGSVDISISKLNPTGSNLIYATYVGGTNSEYAHSMICNTADELYILGSTGSNDYPTSAGCFDNSLGGTQDIVITHLNFAGSALVGSTFMGGSGTDGTNTNYVNYGDPYRGEIYVDNVGDAYIASFTESNNFPTTAGCYDNTYNGMQDAVFFKLGATMSTLMWSTYFGGSDDDSGFGIRVNSSGDAVVCGGTSSLNLPTTAGCNQPAYAGGTNDGYIAIIANNGTTLTSCTYYGTSGYDQAFFLDLDNFENVIIFGQTDGAIAITPGTFGNAGSGSFIAKLEPTLAFLYWQTVIGNGNNTDHIVPTAFLVDVCNNIYISGFSNWSGGSNNNFPVSANAIYNNNLIGNFYLAVFTPNCASLFYGTYYGGSHVDGGTSRFDKNGIVYQGVCQGGSGFPTLATAYATSTTVGWDIAVFKIDFQAVGVIANANALPTTTGCAPFNIQFNNQSNATNYIWDFGDGSLTDTATNPIHLFVDTGTYTVTLFAIDTLSCNISDTTFLTITVLPPPLQQPTLDTTICGGAFVTLDASPSFTAGSTYQWSTGANTSTITVNTAGQVTVVVDNGFCSITDTFNVLLLTQPNLGNDTLMCLGESILLDADNAGTNFLWSTGATTQTIQVNAQGTYWVQVTVGGCIKTDTINVTTLPNPVVVLGPDTTICPGTIPNVYLNAGYPGSQYLWNTGETTQTIYATNLGTYSVTVTVSGCVNSDSIQIFEGTPQLALPDVEICGTHVGHISSNMVADSYLWNTGATSPVIEVTNPGEYFLHVTYNGCIEDDTCEVTGSFGNDVLWVPNSFTPNGDGINEIFTAYGADINYFDMKMFNRWGDLIYETKDIASGWNGALSSNTVQNDVYVYIMEYSTPCLDGKIEKVIGHVSVLK